jgi:hypothetical protein
MTSPHRRTLVELDGDTTELQVLLSVAPACDCAIVPGPGDTLCWLSGTKIDDSASPQQARDEANKILALLNGLARLENPEHRNVDLADCVSQNGRLHHCASPGWRSRAGSQSFVFGSFLGGAVAPPVDPAVEFRRKRLVADPMLAEIVAVFGEEMSWRRQRLAFEKINALVGNGDNALVKHKYAKQTELNRFKENVEDPRHSGMRAVHGVPKGRLTSAKMTEGEGLDFVVRLLDAYLEKNPP